MKILKYESVKNSTNTPPEEREAPKRNVANIFNIQKITEELSRYNIDITASPIRQYNTNLWVSYITAPYKGKVNNIINPPLGAKVALFIDYDNETAFAMPRKGSSKQTLMLIASVCNKYINEPFEADSDIRYELIQSEVK